jgi:hypothetical protein
MPGEEVASSPEERKEATTKPRDACGPLCSEQELEGLAEYLQVRRGHHEAREPDAPASRAEAAPLKIETDC